MCDPYTATAVALSGLSTGLQYKAQEEQVEATNEHRREVHKQNQENALKAYRHNTNQEQSRLLQEEASATQEMQRIRNERQRKAGDALASSQAAGLNMDALLSDYLRQEGEYRSAIKQQLDWERQQSRANMKGMKAQAEDRMASTMYMRESSPSKLAALVTFGDKAFSTFGNSRRGS